ncbi:hypothetical protein DFH06DRAFT_1385469 [Mycena polygramma]|nr:hypothetical protein DFH06DRAFT_1385469 [Mycena polygramma]
MVEEPAPFVFRHRFMKTLPKWISTELWLHRGVTAEFSDYQLMRTHARQMWEVDNAIKMGESYATATAGNSRRTRDYTNGQWQTDNYRTDRPDRNPRTVVVPANNNHTARPRWEDRDRGEDKDCTCIDKAPAGKSSGNAGCFNCSGTDHYTRDKVCPKYEEGQRNREHPRVAAERVLESYSDEDTNPHSSDYKSDYSDEADPKVALDLDILLPRAEAEDNDEGVRVAAMCERPRICYYSMQIVTESDGESSEVESSITASSVTDSETETEGVPDSHPTDSPPIAPIPLGNYNPGPVCMHLICLG